MKNAPIPLVLDMWAYGCSASVIAHALGFDNEKHVLRIVDRARSIRDPRAVLHQHRDGRPAGRLERVQRVTAEWPEVRVVPLVKNVACCPHGHRYTKLTIWRTREGRRQCRVCNKLRKRAERSAA